MNLEDVLDPECGLQQDEWSLSKPTFGDDGQLQVIGWSSRDSSGNKRYMVKCKTCSQDRELFGDGVFRSTKSNLVSGTVPCGCSKITKWTEGQYRVLCERKVATLGYVITDRLSVIKGVHTDIPMLCEWHDRSFTRSINNLLRTGATCPECFRLGLLERNTRPDIEMVNSFLSCGQFPEGTLFSRSDRQDKSGRYKYWKVHCPVCNTYGEALPADLRKGQRPCACNIHRQQECYINWIVDGDNKVAIKFGIARDSKQRVKQQNTKSIYEVQQYQVYTFPDVASCKKAERECKKELECGILLKRDMPDGWSETTWVYNLSKIQDIYKRNGGELV